MNIHIPVLLKETIEGLALKEGDVVLDATVGNGGHAKEICARIGKRGTLIGFDLDETALENAREKLADCPGTIHVKKENFRSIKKFLEELHIRTVDKAFFDLGMRSEQIEASGRGFSFLKDEPLLMTFDSAAPDSALTAFEIVNRWEEKELEDIFRTYGEEKFARRIAEGIVRARKTRPIRTARELADIIEQSIPYHRKRRGIHPATKVFQAIRVAVNDELEALKEGLQDAFDILAPEGRIAVITFHSLEDRIVKQFFRIKSKENNCILITKKPIRPLLQEIRANPRARSAKLRIIEKLE